MLTKQVLHTDKAPAAIGTYSQGIIVGDLVYLSGQIPLDPATQQLIVGDMDTHVRQAFDNLQVLCEAAGGTLDGIVRMTIYLLDLANFVLVNDIMAEYFNQPYPARAAIAVSQLPKDAQIEIAETILLLE